MAVQFKMIVDEIHYDLGLSDSSAEECLQTIQERPYLELGPKFKDRTAMTRTAGGGQSV